MFRRKGIVPSDLWYFSHEEICKLIFKNANSLEKCVAQAGKTCEYARKIAYIKEPLVPKFEIIGGVRIPNTNIVISFKDEKAYEVCNSDILTMWMEDWQPCDNINHALKIAKEHSYAFAESLKNISSIDDIGNDDNYATPPILLSVLNGDAYTQITTDGNILQVRGNKFRVGAFITGEQQPTHLKGIPLPQRVHVCDWKEFAK